MFTLSEAEYGGQTAARFAMVRTKEREKKWFRHGGFSLNTERSNDERGRRMKCHGGFTIVD